MWPPSIPLIFSCGKRQSSRRVLAVAIGPIPSFVPPPSHPTPPSKEKGWGKEKGEKREGILLSHEREKHRFCLRCDGSRIVRRLDSTRVGSASASIPNYICLLRESAVVGVPISPPTISNTPPDLRNFRRIIHANFPPSLRLTRPHPFNSCQR